MKFKHVDDGREYDLTWDEYVNMAGNSKLVKIEEEKEPRRIKKIRTIKGDMNG